LCFCCVCVGVGVCFGVGVGLGVGNYTSAIVGANMSFAVGVGADEVCCWCWGLLCAGDCVICTWSFFVVS